jgi:hypothetical protein
VVFRFPKPPDMSALVRQGQERARRKGTFIGRPKGSRSSTIERRHRRWAAEVDVLIENGQSLKQARGEVAAKAKRHPKTIERAHREFRKNRRLKELPVIGGSRTRAPGSEVL